jgi:hypothetical protein
MFCLFFSAMHAKHCDNNSNFTTNSISCSVSTAKNDATQQKMMQHKLPFTNSITNDSCPISHASQSNAISCSVSTAKNDTTNADAAGQISTATTKQQNNKNNNTTKEQQQQTKIHRKNCKSNTITQ